MMCAGRAGIVFLLLVTASLPAQTPPPGDTANGWNGGAALQLMLRARARREQPRGDTALRNYSAKATGFVYFYLDRNQADDRTPVKVDQVALELFWAAPNLTKQRIVGLRDKSLLPNKMYYHLDHLTVVQNGFGDVIRLGDGDEVSDVPHPAAPSSDTVYDFRLADSLQLNFPPQPPVRVYEVQVRPKHRDRSALVGSIFIDHASADIVRMTFTFTPASYVDRRLDYINISLDNGLWSGSYWLPNEQYVEIRRQIPELDFAAGAVIKGRLRVYDYKFNQSLPRDFFFGRPIEAASAADRARFPFEEDILAGLNREELSPIPQIDALRAEAIRLIRGRKLSGLPPLRLHVPNASSVLRYNRAEGLYLGLGLTYDPAVRIRFDALAGYAIAARKPGGSLAIRLEPNAASSLVLRGYYREPRDLSPTPTVPGALNTISSLFGNDYHDLYYARGTELRYARSALGEGIVSGSIGLEQHEEIGRNVLTAPLGDEPFRFEIGGTRGTLLFGRGSLDLPVWSSSGVVIHARPALEVGQFSNEEGSTCGLFPGDPCGQYATGGYLRPVIEFDADYFSASRKWSTNTSLSLGAVFGEPPIQKVFFLGGVGTVPGHPSREMIGRRYILASVEVARDVAAPWVRLRLTGAAGSAGGSELPWDSPRATYHRAASAGLGVGLLWDVLRLDYVFAGQKHGYRFFFSVRPDFWHML
ncbi:MAG: hypothetical protein WEE89_08020 [Gemmatimonadota bacterium]